jgi:hypothetical protein
MVSKKVTEEFLRRALHCWLGSPHEVRVTDLPVTIINPDITRAAIIEVYRDIYFTETLTQQNEP